MNSSIRRVVAALLITVSVISCGDAADKSATVLATVSTSSAASTPSTLAAPATTPTAPTTTASANAQLLRVEVVARVPHDRGSFTEGLVMAGGKLYEGSGLRGESTLREVDPRSGAVTRSIPIATKYFGEGIAVVDDRVIQLTWQEHTALVYQLSDFKQVTTFTYETEGWGLCDDGARLVMSDGTNQLYFRNRSTFAVQGKVSVTKNGVPIDQLNELECVDGQVYANVWQTDTIVRIDPASGRVTAEIDASGLLSADEQRGTDVLNGIAYDPATKNFLLTGKYWPAMFTVRFVAV
ncbi:MAG: glutaminyl-peptide cyclotransferase [Acidimicrobiales bacterium]